MAAITATCDTVFLNIRHDVISRFIERFDKFELQLFFIFRFLKEVTSEIFILVVDFVRDASLFILIFFVLVLIFKKLGLSLIFRRREAARHEFRAK